MNELEPDAWRSQWRWFGAALLAMSTIATILTRLQMAKLQFITSDLDCYAGIAE